jgi:leucyl/phenylalanyl-tRNA---protein transferase
MSPSRYQDWASFKFPDGPGEPADGAGEAPVAFCADLSPASVLGAYRRGIVPMPAADEFFRGLNEIRFEEQVAAGTIALVGDQRDDPYLVAWWSPDPRLTVPADGVHLGRNVRKRLRRDGLTTTANADFRRVAEACRAGSPTRCSARSSSCTRPAGRTASRCGWAVSWPAARWRSAWAA